MRLRTQRQLNNLRSVLNAFSIDEDLYSLGSYSEDRVCLAPSGTGWSVFEGIRGRNMNEKSHRTLHLAANDIFERLADSAISRKKMENYYQSLNEPKPQAGARSSSKILIAGFAQRAPLYARRNSTLRSKNARSIRLASVKKK